MVFPGAAAAAASLWRGYNDTLAPKSMPSDVFTQSLNAHVNRLQVTCFALTSNFSFISIFSPNFSFISTFSPNFSFISTFSPNFSSQERAVPACGTGCQCDWGSSCLGDAGKFYGGSATPLHVSVELQNTGCDFPIHIKKRTPCSSETGKDLLVLTRGESGIVSGSDFIATGVEKGVEKDGDQFSVWIGDGTWMDVKLSLEITCEAGTTYINMVPAGGGSQL